MNDHHSSDTTWKGPKWLEGMNSVFKFLQQHLRQDVTQLNGEVSFALALQVLQATYP
jgi:hypothetical protein